MTPDDLRAIMGFLQERVRLKDAEPAGEVAVEFDLPTAEEMTRAGLDAEGSRRILDAPWFDEMVAETIETPEMCDPDDPPEQVLQYAKDVVSEYIRKRATL